MLEGKEEVPVEEVSEQENPETEQPSTEGQEDITAQIKELQDAKVKAEAEAKRLEEGYKGLQTKYNKTHEENKKLADLHSEVGDLKKYIKILAAQQAAREDPDGLDTNKQQEYLKKFEDMEKEAEKRKLEAEAKSKAEEELKRFDEVWDEAQKFGTYEENDNVAELYDALVDRKLYKAERILKKLQASKGEASMAEKNIEPKTITDEEFEAEAKRRGLLKTDAAIPSGRSGSFAEAEERFASGDMSFAEYSEIRKKAGIY